MKFLVRNDTKRNTDRNVAFYKFTDGILAEALQAGESFLEYLE